MLLKGAVPAGTKTRRQAAALNSTAPAEGWLFAVAVLALSTLFFLMSSPTRPESSLDKTHKLNKKSNLSMQEDLPEDAPISFAQPAILKSESKKAPAKAWAFLLKRINRLERRIWP